MRIDDDLFSLAMEVELAVESVSEHESLPFDLMFCNFPCVVLADELLLIEKFKRDCFKLLGYD